MLSLRRIITPFLMRGAAVQIKSVPSHSPTIIDDTMEGRYATALFSTASKAGQLDVVYEEISAFQLLYRESLKFHDCLKNMGLGKKEFQYFLDVLNSAIPLSDTTMHFMKLLHANKRLVYLNHIIHLYSKFYENIRHEANVVIVSAEELKEEEKQKVISSLKAAYSINTVNTVYKINPSIIGGLQIYTEKDFLDLSIASRIDKIKDLLYKEISV